MPQTTVQTLSEAEEESKVTDPGLVSKFTLVYIYIYYTLKVSLRPLVIAVMCGKTVRAAGDVLSRYFLSLCFWNRDETVSLKKGCNMEQNQTQLQGNKYSCY